MSHCNYVQFAHILQIKYSPFVIHSYFIRRYAQMFVEGSYIHMFASFRDSGFEALSHRHFIHLAYSPRKKFIHTWIYVEKFRRIREIICVKVKSAKHWARQTIRESFVNGARLLYCSSVLLNVRVTVVESQEFTLESRNCVRLRIIYCVLADKLRIKVRLS